MSSKRSTPGSGQFPWVRFIVFGTVSCIALSAILNDAAMPYRAVQTIGMDLGKVPKDVMQAKQRKIFTDFDAFFPFYMEQHLEPGTKLAHFIGTSLSIIVLLANPSLLVAMMSGMLTRLWMAPLFVKRTTNGALEALCVAFTYISVSNLLRKEQKVNDVLQKGVVQDMLSTMFIPRNWKALLVPSLGYSFAWFGHFFVEMNRPATFLYPTYSLLGDFKMFFLILPNPTAYLNFK